MLLMILYLIPPHQEILIIYLNHQQGTVAEPWLGNVR